MQWFKNWFKGTPVAVKEVSVVDFPKGAYKAYWEIVLNPVPGGLHATLRFYGYQGGQLISETSFIEPTQDKLRAKLNEVIAFEMNKQKR